ncbi:27kDa outer membrane protein [Caenispirillum salinarum AK4]|uniref:27kDa outer membrane protein n=1 Tax=Caenispirillum salinarum AK4 TaxID=1238182 RepID=K9HU51_9PROT|nr:thioredoxin domain-containing protein [Caenispirillum salinarum]EKV31771.1 27kDa outer membrane protein [Caenispirillum salinarum AK4]
MTPRARRAALAAACLLLAAVVLPLGWAWTLGTEPARAAGVIVDERDKQVLTPRAVAESGTGVVTGNPQGDVTLVEYFDYQCPVCRRVHPDVRDLVDGDGNIRVIHKHWPIFGDASVAAAKLALAARWQGAEVYDAVHHALMTLPGRLTSERARAAAAEAGLDLARADAALAERADAVVAQLQGVASEAAQMGLRGTPVFLVGSYFLPGGPDRAALETLVEGVRKGEDRL